MSIERDQTNNSTRGSLRLAPNVEDLEEHKRKLPRQFVNFTFYRARPEWRMLDDGEKISCKEDFVRAVDEFRPELLIRTYSTRSEEHTSELQSLAYLVCRLLLEKKKKK